VKNFFKRWYDLIIKLISVKTIPAVIFSIGYLANSNWENATACFLAWALVIGVRYAEKVAGLVKKE
jgi:hypothetical protein